MIRRSDVSSIVNKTFHECKSAGARKLRIRAADSYAGLTERQILKITNNKFKYRKYNAKFTNKAIPRPVRAKEILQQIQIDLVNLSSQRVEYDGIVYRYILSIMDVFSRFHWLAPLERKFPSHVSLHLERIFAEHGPPSRLQSDNGGEFKKEVIKVIICLSHLLYYLTLSDKCLSDKIFVTLRKRRHFCPTKLCPIRY